MKSNGSQQKQTVREILDSGAVLEAARIGAKRAMRINKLLGMPIVTSKDGKVVWIPPEEIQVDKDFGGPDAGRASGEAR
jgi:hypothetical protein